MMYRLFEEKLIDWKNNGMKKPLMVVGVRQIGKTYLIEKFAKENFEEYLYFNLQKDLKLQSIFENTIDDEEIIKNLELYIGKKIDLDKTIIFFDEVQESENCIVSLKYFNESDKPYKIICAGSLLGVKINRFQSSFPVGKVRIEYMYPLNFEEFLLATGNELLKDKIEECYKNMEPMPDFAHEQAIDLYRKYLCVGGMPEAVNNFVDNDLDILKFDSHILEDIEDMYVADMKRYISNKAEAINIEKIYKNIPMQLAKKNRVFRYNYVDEDGRKRKYESSLDWLVSSKMIMICHNSKKIEVPLRVYIDDNKFKLYLSDVGLLSVISELKYSSILLDDNFMFKGALAENYVAQELTSMGNSLYYYTTSSTTEIDFLINNDDGIIPIEVKSGSNTRSISLNKYIEKYNPKYAIRFSTKNFGFDNNIKSIPLYAVFCIK